MNIDKDPEKESCKEPDPDRENDLDKAPESGTPLPPPIPTPPPTPDEEWAERLGLHFDEEEARRNHQRPAAPAPQFGQPAQQYPQDAPQFGQPAQQYPQGAPQFGQPAQQQMPPSYLLWSVLSLVLCCLIPAVVALIYSLQVSSKFYAGDIAGAHRASERAQIWIIVSVVLGVISAGFYLPMMMFQP